MTHTQKYSNGNTTIIATEIAANKIVTQDFEFSSWTECNDFHNRNDLYLTFTKDEMIANITNS